MKKTVFILLLLISSQFSFSNISETEGKAMLKAAQNAYEAGRFDSAKVVYEKMISKGLQSWEVLYNLGNAYYKTGDLPNAILYYERAKMLHPNDEDLLFNLQLAYSRIPDKIEALPDRFTMDDFIGLLSTDSWATSSVFLFVIFLVSLFLFFYLPSLTQKRFFLGVFVASFLVSSLTFVMAYESKQLTTNSNAGIIFDPSVTVKSAPGSAGKKLFIVHEGLKVEVLEVEGDFARVRIADGNVGWVPEASYKKI